MSKLDSQVASSSRFSFSAISEPPDIKNWFSCYTYQSPVLDTNELVGDSHYSHRIDELKRGIFVEDSENEVNDSWVDLRKTRNCKSTEETKVLGNPPAIEGPASPYSLSLPSEPPDIRNWFSSYEYESPALNSADFNVTSKYDVGHIEDIDKGREEKLKALPLTDIHELVFCKETTSNSCTTENNKNHSTGQGKDDLEGSRLFSTNNLCPERTSCQNTQGTAPRSSSVIPDKSGEFLRTEAEDPPTILQEDQDQRTSNVNHLTSSPKASYRRQYVETVEGKTERKSVIHENDSGWILPNHKSREADCKRIKKEYMCTDSECTLVKKKSRVNMNDENCSEELGDRNSSVSCKSKGKDGMLRREVLKEKTNFQQTYVMEVAGKWRCPQRSKPNTGPPLKQLRLEKWVHRI